MNIKEKIRKIESTDFFSKTDEQYLEEDIILIPNFEIAYVKPNEIDFKGLYTKMIFLPSSLDEKKDPFYGELKIPKELHEVRMEITKILFEKVRNLNQNLFKVDSQNFFIVFKYSIAYAFRQSIVEQHLNLGLYWNRIVNLYYKGYFPFGFYKNKIFVI